MLKCDRDERKHIVSVYIGLEKDYRLICCILNKKRKQKQKSLWKRKICVFFHKQQKKEKSFAHHFTNPVYHDLISLSIAIVEVESVSERKSKGDNNI